MQNPKVIFNFIPEFCPNCGQPLNIGGPFLDDFMNGVEMNCRNCGQLFAKQMQAPIRNYCCDSCGSKKDLGACEVTIYCRDCADTLLDASEIWTPLDQLEVTES